MQFSYPMSTGGHFDEILRVLDSFAADRSVPGLYASKLAPGRPRDHQRFGLEQRSTQEMPWELEGAEAVFRDRGRARLEDKRI
jgi:hypothetical protein